VHTSSRALKNRKTWKKEHNDLAKPDLKLFNSQRKPSDSGKIIKFRFSSIPVGEDALECNNVIHGEIRLADVKRGVRASFCHRALRHENVRFGLAIDWNLLFLVEHRTRPL